MGTSLTEKASDVEGMGHSYKAFCIAPSGLEAPAPFGPLPEGEDAGGEEAGGAAPARQDE